MATSTHQCALVARCIKLHPSRAIAHGRCLQHKLSNAYKQSRPSAIGAGTITTPLYYSPEPTSNMVPPRGVAAACSKPAMLLSSP